MTTKIDYATAANTARRLVSDSLALQSLLPVLDDLAGRKVTIESLTEQLERAKAEAQAAVSEAEAAKASSQAAKASSQAAIAAAREEHEREVARLSAIELKFKGHGDEMAERAEALRREVAELEEKVAAIRATVAAVVV